MLRTDDARRGTEESGRNPPKEPLVSVSPHASGHLHRHPSEPPFDDRRVENSVAVAFEVLTAIVVVVAGILALLIII